MLREITFAHLVSTVFSIYMDMHQDDFGYERMHRFGLGNRIVPNYRRYVGMDSYHYPEPLPSSTPSSLELIPTPYHRLYQGRRREGDTRVYYKKFSYEPTVEGHNVVCRGSLNCKVTHLSVESASSIPIILRGGVGYTHFIVIVKARPGDTLAGKIKAYCMKSEVERFL